MQSSDISGTDPGTAFNLREAWARHSSSGFTAFSTRRLFTVMRFFSSKPSHTVSMPVLLSVMMIIGSSGAGDEIVGEVVGW
jgi:hypothetical protein